MLDIASYTDIGGRARNEDTVRYITRGKDALCLVLADGLGGHGGGELDGGTHAFLLCSDGFWEYVLEPEMEEDLAKAAGPEDWLERMRWRLKKRIPADNDNNTAASVWVNER